MNAKNRKTFWMASLSLFIVSLVCCISAYSVYARLQFKENLALVRLVTSDFQPIEIAKASVGGSEVVSGRKFKVTNDDWLSSLIINLKNTTAKRIDYVEFAINFPNDSQTGKQILPPLVMARGKSSAIPKPNRELLEDLSLAPNDTAEISVNNFSLVHLQKGLQTSNTVISRDALRNPSISLKMVIFDDETMWYKGYWMERDKEDSNKWNTISPDRYTSYEKSTANSLKTGKIVPASYNRAFNRTSAGYGCYHISNISWQTCNWYLCTFIAEEFQSTDFGWNKDNVTELCGWDFYCDEVQFTKLSNTQCADVFRGPNEPQK